jgi:hypothetical protein
MMSDVCRDARTRSLAFKLGALADRVHRADRPSMSLEASVPQMKSTLVTDLHIQVLVRPWLEILL